MAVHVSKVHSEEIGCWMREYQTKYLESLDIHLETCQHYECKNCEERFQSISEIKKAYLRNIEQ